MASVQEAAPTDVKGGDEAVKAEAQAKINEQETAEAAPKDTEKVGEKKKREVEPVGDSGGKGGSETTEPSKTEQEEASKSNGEEGKKENSKEEDSKVETASENVKEESGKTVEDEIKEDIKAQPEEGTAAEENNEEKKEEDKKEEDIPEEASARVTEVEQHEDEKKMVGNEEEIPEEVVESKNQEQKHAGEEVTEEVQAEDEDEDEDGEEEEEENQADLEELMAQAKEERRALMKKNISLQKQILSFWEVDRRSQLELKEHKLTSKGTEVVSEQKTNYMKNLELIKNLVKGIEDRVHEFRKKIQNSEKQLDTLDEKASSVNEAFKTFKREIAVDSLDQQTGKPLKFKRILAFESTEAAKDKEVEDARLTNIHYTDRLSKLVNKVRKNEELADGLSMIDFEQLKIENQTLSEKIEERNDELHKLIKKTRSTVEVLTHVKEKLQFVQAEERSLRKKLEALDGKSGRVTLLLDKVMKLKKKRDALREELVLLQGQAGFVGSDVLVSDYEKRRLTNEGLKETLEELQAKHKKSLAILAKYKPTEIHKFTPTKRSTSSRQGGMGGLKIN